MRKLFLLALLVTIPLQLDAAIAFRQDDGNGNDASSATVVQAFGLAVLAGSSLEAYVTWPCAGGETLNSVGDTVNGAASWTRVGTTAAVASSGGDWCIGLFNFLNTAAGTPTVTATLSAASLYRAIIIVEYTGVATSAAVDQFAKNSQVDAPTSTDGITSGNVTTGSNNELISSGVTLIQGIGPTAGTGFNTRLQVTTLFSFLAVEDKLLASAGTTAGTWTESTVTHDTATIVATFKEPGAAAGTTKSLTMMGVGDND